MNRDQFAFTFTKVLKPRPTLENIPEDVSVIIAECIKNWATVEGNLEQREKARRLRDSALRAVALSSRRSHETYRPILWQNVTLDLRHFFSFCQALKGDEKYASPIRFLHFKPSGEWNAEERHSFNSQLASASSLNSKDLTEQTYDGMLQLLEFAYGRLIHLQSLVIINGIFIPPSLSQLSCFSTTLKRLFIPFVHYSNSPTRLATPLNARNVIWLLSFGSIEEAALGFTVSRPQDFRFLQEHHDYFFGTSNVRKLSLSFEFVCNKRDRKTWWSLPKEKKNGFKHGNRKSEAIALLLNVVNNQLRCLELYPTPYEDPNPDDKRELSFRCLLNLAKSGTLHHLRLVNWVVEKLTGEFSPFPLFRSLKTISLEFNFLHVQVSRNQDSLNKSKLPPSLERIVLSYYAGSEEQFPLVEDKLLAQLINSQVLPNLTEAIVPSTAVGSLGTEVEGLQQLEVWAQRRRELENEAVFKSGKVRLTQADRVCSVIPDSQTFMSHLRWLSPPF